MSATNQRNNNQTITELSGTPVDSSYQPMSSIYSHIFLIIFLLLCVGLLMKFIHAVYKQYKIRTMLNNPLNDIRRRRNESFETTMRSTLVIEEPLPIYTPKEEIEESQSIPYTPSQNLIVSSSANTLVIPINDIAVPSSSPASSSLNRSGSIREQPISTSIPLSHSSTLPSNSLNTGSHLPSYDDSQNYGKLNL